MAPSVTSLTTTVRRLAARRPAGCRLPPLVLVLDARLRDPLAAVAALPKGAAVLLRHRDAAGLVRLGVAVAPLCRRRGLILLVSGDWRLAARLRAGGLHLPEAMAAGGRLAPAIGWRRRTGALLSVATHSPAALSQARRLGADAAFLSPLFATRSHPGAPGLGVRRFRLWARAAGVPVVALGGIDDATAAAAVDAGACGLAAVEALGPP